MSLPTASEAMRSDPPNPPATIERTEPSALSPSSLSAPRSEGATVIRLENVTVEYRVPREPIRTFKEYAIRLVQGRVKHDEFRALAGVSLEINQGEVFGII